MSIGERILEIIKSKKMTQKEFSVKTGIPASTICEWGKKKTSPSADKILIICETLGISPYELLSGATGEGKKRKTSDTIVVSKSSEEGELLVEFQNLGNKDKGRVLGYLAALKKKK